MTSKRTRYHAIDGLRAFSAIGIVLMHVRANGGYAIGGFLYNSVILSFTELVFLFMIISAFGMCCGYYEKVMGGGFAVDKFYKKRYSKILPFFALLCLCDCAVSRSLSAAYETFADLTLCFGLLPNAGGISVIGVGWFLGVVFLFYMLFPYYCFLIGSKKRAWLSFAASIAMWALCEWYFHVDRKNILYCAVFFMAGGLIYLYREPIVGFARRVKWLMPAICLAAAAGYYALGPYVPIMLVLFSSMLICAVSQRDTEDTQAKPRVTALQNPIVKFLSGISMEIYLCHMMIYRVLEKLGLVHVFPSETLSYVFTSVLTLIGAIIFAKTAQIFLNRAGSAISRRLGAK